MGEVRHLGGAFMRLFLIDDQVMFRQGLKSLLERTSTFIVSGEFNSALRAVSRIRDCGADIILLDTSVGSDNSLPETVAILKEVFPDTPVLAVSRHVDSVT